jgi:hypothetical protein
VGRCELLGPSAIAPRRERDFTGGTWFFSPPMTLHVALAVSALAASAALYLSRQSRVLAVVALLASALEVAMAFGALRLALPGIQLGLALGLALAIPGLIAWLRASAKLAVSAAAVIAFAGALQVFVALNGRV